MDLDLKSAQIVDICGESCGFADFETHSGLWISCEFWCGFQIVPVSMFESSFLNKIWIIDLSSALAVIHLPARPVSQTHKFPKRCTNLVPHASIWTQIISITITAYVFSLLQGIWQDAAMRICIKFANIHICIIWAFFHIKQKNCAILAIKQLPYNPKFQRDWLFWRRVSSEIETKTPQFVCDKPPAFDRKAWKLVSKKLPGYKAMDVPRRQPRILHRKWVKKLYGTHSFVWGTRRFLAVRVPGLTTAYF